MSADKETAWNKMKRKRTRQSEPGEGKARKQLFGLVLVEIVQFPMSQNTFLKLVAMLVPL